MRTHLLIALFSLACACSSEGRGDGRKGTFAGNTGGPSAFGNNASAPSFGENAGSGPSFGENAGSGPSFGETATPAGDGDPTQACSKAAPCPAPALCTESSSVGFCVVQCTLGGTGDVEVGVCPAGMLCLRGNSKSSTGVCLHQCSSAADCAPLTGLRATCESGLGTRICVWTAPVSETPAAPAGS